MNKKKIEITIDIEGGTSIDVDGYKDGSCRTATEAIEEALGGVSARVLKDRTRKAQQTVKA